MPMDNPQHYQPLSHALYPPLTASPHLTNLPSGSGSKQQQEPPREEMNDGEEDDDEGMVEEQLHENDAVEMQFPNSSHTSPGDGNGDRTGSAGANGHANGAQTGEQQEDNPPAKRRPGRPRGSKNRSKCKSTSEPASSNQQQSTSTSVNPQNKQYYEFQWRVLNLCAEFYGAAEELVKGTPPLVIAQSYHMGPSIKVDPLTLLNDAKKICDTLLANPSQLTISPPPPMHPQMPNFPPSSPPNSASATGKFSVKPASVIINSQSFTMPLSSPSLQLPVQFPYPQQNQAPYQTMPYYSQPYVGVPYVPNSGAPSTSGSVPLQANPPGSAGAQGTWTDEEESRLKQLAEQSKSVGNTEGIEWDWVVNQWGPNRTRHQILIKATALGLKASSTRGQKRRRGSVHDVDADGPPAASTSTPASAPASAVGGIGIATAPSTTSSISQPASAQPSPASQHSRPPSQAATSVSRLVWPAPVVAADTPSPIIISSTQQQDPHKPYYRPDANLKPDSLSSHHYVYQPNGKGGAGSKFSKQNGR